MSDDKILKSIKNLQKRYTTEIESEQEDPQQTFLEELNSLIQLIFDDRSTDVYTTLNQEALEKWKKNRWRRVFKALSVRNILYFAFLVVITTFLIHEAVAFYAIGGVVTAAAYTKAILTEISFIFLNGFRSIGKLQSLAVSGLRVGVFCLMLFVITSEVTMTGTNQRGEIDSISQRIELIEGQIEEKDKSIEFYRKKNWGGNAARVEKEKQELVEQLIELREQQAEGKSENASDLILYKTWGRATFRVLLLFISVLVTRRLFKF